MTTASTADSCRDDKARFALANSRQWLRLRDRATGRVVAYGFASVSRPGTYHLATPHRCTCDDAQWGHRCYHQRAVALHVARIRAQQGVAMYMRVTRGRVDLSRYDEAVSAVPGIVAALSRLPGNQSYLTGMDRANGRTMAVSTWDTEDHARFSNDAVPDLASRLQAVGLQVEATEISEVTTT